MAEVQFLGFGDRSGYGADTGAEVVYDGKGTPVFDGTISVQLLGLNSLPPLYRGAEASFGALGTPVFDGTIDIEFLGFGDRKGYGPDTGPDVVYGAVGKPEFDGSREVELTGLHGLPPLYTGAEAVYGAKGTPEFDGSREVRNIGVVLLDFDNQGRNVELGAVGKPAFPGVAQIVNSIPPEVDVGAEVVYYPGGTPFNPGQVTFFQQGIYGPTYPVQGPTAPPGVNIPFSNF